MNTNHSDTPRWINTLGALFIGLFFASYFNEGFNIFSALLALMAIAVLIYHRKGQTNTKVKELQLLNWTFGFFAINLAIITLSALLDLDTRSVGSSIEYPSKALLLCIISYMIIFSRASEKSMCYGLTVGAVIGAFISGYDVYVNLYRGFNLLMPIQKGNAAILFSSLLFTLSLYWHKSNRKLAWLCLFGANLALAASALSLSRGGWILAPATYLIAAVVFFKSTSRNYLVFAILTLLATLWLVVVTAPVSIEERVASTASDSGSVGVRIEMWKFAWQLFLEKPIFGWGEHALQFRLDQAVTNGELSELARQYNGNSHSAYLNALSQRGIIGFMGLMAFLAAPGILYLVNLIKATSEETKLWATLGGINILSTAGFCVSQAHFLHNEGVVLYATTNAILLGFLIRAKHAENR